MLKDTVLSVVGITALGLSGIQTVSAGWAGFFDKDYDYREVTPEVIQKYNSVEEALAAYSVTTKTLRDGRIEYRNNFLIRGDESEANGYRGGSYKIPRRIITYSCEKEGGKIRLGNQKTEQVKSVTVGIYNDEPQGIFGCKVNGKYIWAVMVKVTELDPTPRLNKLPKYTFGMSYIPADIYMKKYYTPQTHEEVEELKKTDSVFAKNEAERSARGVKEIDANFQRYQDKEASKKALAPSTKDIGKTICNDTMYGQFGNKYYEDGSKYYFKQYGDVVAKLEDVSPDGKNIKINLRGIGASGGKFATNGDWQYNGVAIKNGNISWEPNYNWRVCAYI
ncbi:hypothetical protein HLH17_13930 [Acinetobacter sp. ANC 5380]|uniref:Uncharacterized protein n=1 Tax=Acinetobacter terrae TaxID=2731247 RepID=A0A7Y2RHB6_9GAMM|nr:hypothetical protein [Acinetobacter terrae]NNH78728.1 hypothetical protein [Acinetobacter terrae]